MKRSFPAFAALALAFGCAPPRSARRRRRPPPPPPAPPARRLPPIEEVKAAPVVRTPAPVAPVEVEPEPPKPERVEDFMEYVRTSKDFRRVPQERAMLLGRWDRWVLMPWRYRWGRDYDDDLARMMKEAGHNGGFCDRSPRADASLHEKYGFLWYLDHTAGKGILYLRKNQKDKAARTRPNRPICLASPDAARRLKENIENAVTKAKAYSTRAAYSLDDEVSWSGFTSPCKWDNSPDSIEGFNGWLVERWGSRKKVLEAWGPGTEGFLSRMATPDDFQHLYDRAWPEWNLAPWCDAVSYMDSQFNNLVGEMVEYANSLDPETPCGYVGGQAPAPYGGFDYAKVMRKLQFLEAYDIGCSMEIARSFNPGNMMPLVQTGFGDPNSPKGTWFLWYYLAHGNRGVIYWAEQWFKDDADTRRKLELGEEIRLLERISRKAIGGEWKHDGVAVYYSHPSVQVGWFIDCEPHGRTWINRSSSLNNKHASTIAADWAWAKLLEDERVQYNFLSYADVLEKGGIDPAEYKVLILPHVLALSDQEAEIIRDYVRRGGAVIADHLTGWFDHHGRGRARPVLDDLFGIIERPVCGPGKCFGGKLLAETDQDTYYKATFLDAAKDIWPTCRKARGFAVAERELTTFIKQRTGEGWAILLNVSVMEYALTRSLDYSGAAEKRRPVGDLLREAGIEPWVKLSVAGGEPDITEAVYWEKDGRVYLFVVKNPLRFASEFGEVKTEGVSRKEVRLTVALARPVRSCRDEFADEDLGEGKSFSVKWRTDRAALISFEQ